MTDGSRSTNVVGGVDAAGGEAADVDRDVGARDDRRDDVVAQAVDEVGRRLAPAATWSG